MFLLLRSRVCKQGFFWAMIEKENVDPKCRVCGKAVEFVGHVTSGCTGLE